MTGSEGEGNKFPHEIELKLAAFRGAQNRGEREFPFPGNTSLKFPVPSLPVAFLIFPSRSREKEVLDGN